MKRKGFTLIELVVVIALIAILAATLAPRLRDQIAKAKDAKAIAALGGLRTGSELMYAETGNTTFTGTLTDAASGVSGSDLVTMMDEYMDSSTKGFVGDEATVEVGGTNTEAEAFTYGGNVKYTFADPITAASGDGISLWITPETSTAVKDTKKNYWASY